MVWQKITLYCLLLILNSWNFSQCFNLVYSVLLTKLKSFYLFYMFLYECWVCFSHGGPQSTVVHSRVRHTQILDHQWNCSWCCIQFCKKSLLKIRLSYSITKWNFIQNECWWYVWQMFIPEEIHICICSFGSVIAHSNDLICFTCRHFSWRLVNSVLPPAHWKIDLTIDHLHRLF